MKLIVVLPLLLSCFSFAQEDTRTFAALQQRVLAAVNTATSSEALFDSLSLLLRDRSRARSRSRSRSQSQSQPQSQSRSLPLAPPLESAEKVALSPPQSYVAVIGGGLSGLTAALRLLEQDQSVVLIDKSSFFGGNSAKASSGINGAYTDRQKHFSIDDSVEQFYEDTVKSSSREDDVYTTELIRRMVSDSKNAVNWLSTRASVDLPDVGVMGGHSIARTHRPRNGLAGAAFINGLEKAIRAHEKKGMLRVLLDTRVVSLMPTCKNAQTSTCKKVDIEGWSVALENQITHKFSALNVGAVVMATGGFGNDKSPNSLLNEADESLKQFKSTNGKFATGDGIKLGRSVGAKTVDLDLVQVHPTGFSEVQKGFEADADSPLILCAEIVRGSGAVLLDADGSRFVDELKTRKDVSNAILNNDAAIDNKVVIALKESDGEKVPAHVKIYGGKGLLTKVDGVTGVQEFIKRKLNGSGEFVSKTFDSTTRNATDATAVPRKVYTSLPQDSSYWVGVVEPVIHYTMGGLGVNSEGGVITADDEVIPRLYGVGELMGGVHGENRLGGSSLLDCVVFGIAAADAIVARNEGVVKDQRNIEDLNFVELDEMTEQYSGGAASAEDTSAADNTSAADDTPAADDWEKDNGPAITIINGKKYDISKFIEVHPGGPISVTHMEDITDRFTHAHGDSFDLLDRDTIVQIDNSGKEVVREKKFYEDYGSQGGSWREFIGRRAWFVLHSFAAKYPEHPSDEDKTAILNLIAAWGQLYPCKLCRKHLQQQLRDPILGPPKVNSRQELSTWMCELHNLVNVDLGKPQTDCTPFAIDMMYLKDCGECEVKKPKIENGKEVFAEGETKPSGYHEYLGPWDAEIYRRDPQLLFSVKDNTDAFETKDLIEMYDAFDVMRKWFRTFTYAEMAALREKIRDASDRGGVIDAIDDLLRPSMDAVKRNKNKAIGI